MAAKPSEYPEWATDDITETVTINGLPETLDNKVEPTAEFKSTGELYRQNLPRPFVNWMLNKINQWINHLDQRYAVGDVHLTISAEDATAISTRLGGTWVQRGTQAIGTITPKVWEKTA